MSKRLREYRDREREHQQWLEQQIESLGGDTAAKTPKSELLEMETEGLSKVILSNDAPVEQKLHALLGVELVENAAWQLLVELAEEAEEDEAKREFSKRLHHEEEHLSLVRKALEKLTMQEVLGHRGGMPTSP